MAYSTGTQNNANCASTFMATLDTALLAAGFTDVETWTSSAKVANIYKSPVASNGVADWYFGIYAATATATELYPWVSEDYDVVNHKFRKYVPGTGTGVTVSASDNTVTDATGQLPDWSAAFNNSNYLTVYATSFTYFFSINLQRIIIATRYSTTDAGHYFGLVDNMLNTTDFPYAGVALWQGKPGTSSSKTLNHTPATAGGGFTREPGAPAAAATNFSGAAPNTASALWPSFAGSASSDWTYKTGLIGARHGIYSDRDASALYVPRALFPVDCLAFPRATGINGDTVTIGAKTYVKMSNGSHQMFVDNSV